nr:retrovirus-related Pol polyprotein from transposon TNT 1-94 [Tanacetum cinerariifolium]
MLEMRLKTRKKEVKSTRKYREEVTTWISAEEQAELKDYSLKKAGNLTSVYGGINIGLRGQLSQSAIQISSLVNLISCLKGPSNTRDTKIAALRLKFNAFKALEGEKVNGNYTRLKCLLNDLENNGVIISQSEVNATFINSLPRKWLSMNQTQRANKSIKNDSLVALYGKYHYEEGLIDDIDASETQRFTIQASSSKALISNNHFQDNDSDIEEDNRTSNEFIADINAKYHEKALLANQKRFYKRCERVGSARKPMNKSKETCFACGKSSHFQKDFPLNKASTSSYPSSDTSFNKPKPYKPSFTPNIPQNLSIHQKDYKGKYKGLKAEMDVLSQRIDELTKRKNDKGNGDKEKSDKGLVVESINWDDEYVSSEKRTTKFKAFMTILKDEPSVGKSDARSGQWVEITIKKVHRLLSMTDNEERKHILDYTHVDLQYVEDQRINLVNKFNALKQDLALYKSKLGNLKNIVSINGSLQNEVIRVNLENESLKDEIYDLKKVIEKWTCSKLTLDQLISEQIPGNIVKAFGRKGRRKKNNSSKEVIFTKADEPLPPLPKLTGVEPSGALKSLILLSDLTANMAELTLNTTSKKVKKSSDKISQTYVIKKKTKPKHLDAQNSCPDKNALPSTEQLLLTLMEEVQDSGCSRRMIEVKQYLHKYSNESGPKVGDKSSGDTEGYGSFNCNEITFTKVAYVNSLKHNLISINRLCDANFNVLFTKTQGTIFNEKDKVVLIAPRRRDVYVIDMSSYNTDSNACFYAKASPSINWLWYTRLSHLNVKNINNLSKYNLVSGLPSLTFSKDKNCSAYEKEKHHRATFKTKMSFSIKKCLHILHMDLFGPIKPQTISHNKYTLVIVDEYSRHMENLNDTKVKQLRSDNKTEFKNHTLEAFCDEKEIIWENLMKRQMMDSFLAIPEWLNHLDFSTSKDKKWKKPFMLLSLKMMRQFRKQALKDSSIPNIEEVFLALDEVFHLDQLLLLSQLIYKKMTGMNQLMISHRFKIRDLEASSAHECLYVNFLSKVKPKKLIEAIEEEVYVLAMTEELNQFEGVDSGYKQEEVIDYDETFAPVARLEAIKIFLAYASYVGFTVYQMDVKSAFLNGKISEKVYVEQPHGFESSEFPNHVRKLNKALYGMKQAPRAWYETLSKFLTQHKFVRGTIDNTLFTYKTQSDAIIVQIYVDDIIFESTSVKLSKQFAKLMTTKYEMSMMGEITYFLGFEIKQDSKRIFIFQEKYVKDLLKKYDLADCALVKCPMLISSYAKAMIELQAHVKLKKHSSCGRSKFEGDRQILDEKLVLVGDDGKPLNKVDSNPVNSDSDSDVEVAYDETV